MSSGAPWAATLPSASRIVTVSTHPSNGRRSCSMSRMTRPGARKSRIAANSDRRPSSSTWAAGSSKIMTSGALATAPAMAIRWRCPPDKAHGSFSASSDSPSSDRASADRLATMPASTRENSRAMDTSSTTRSVSTCVAGSCPTKVTRSPSTGHSVPSTSTICTDPAWSMGMCEGISPAIRWARLVFPHPTGPVMTLIVPKSKERSTMSGAHRPSACRTPAPLTRNRAGAVPRVAPAHAGAPPVTG